jgi:hypothetical protein
MIDPIVNEVRKHRAEHTQRFRGNLSAICDDLRKFQKACGRRIVRLRTRRILQTKKSTVTSLH